ncbi:hypothetical protein ACFQZJ_10110 [Maribacter chungangensis]|uniref:CcmD family protein n=1 Tax=Maribacter chungangensis TaxID=1069117 RepID=A0ABW3B409_9FLAO
MKQFPIGFMILIYGVVFCILIYIIFKRLADRKKEDFEKRDN